MSDAEKPKPCRWAEIMTKSMDGEKTLAYCNHPMVLKFIGKTGAHVVIEESCQGCPGHEPAPEPDHSGDTNKMVCWWKQDEHGNWCCSCRATLPQFTPWRSLSPAGHNCPYCRAIIGVEPRYDEQIHTCGPFCERPACVQRRTEDGEFRRTHDKP